MIYVDCNFSWINSHKIKMQMSPLLTNNNMEELFTPSSVSMPALLCQLYFACLRESHRTWLNCHKSKFFICFYFLRFYNNYIISPLSNSTMYFPFQFHSLVFFLEVTYICILIYTYMHDIYSNYI